MGDGHDRVGGRRADVRTQDDGDGELDRERVRRHESDHDRRGGRRALDQTGREEADDQARHRIGGGVQQLLGESTATHPEGGAHQLDAEEEQVQQEDEVDDVPDPENRFGLAFDSRWGRVGH